MKKIVLPVLSVAILIGAVFAGGVFYGSRHPAAPQPVAVTPTSQPNTPTVSHPAPPPPLMASNDFQKYRVARQEALQTNPALQDNYKDILKSMDAQQTKLDAAMIKANPDLAPVIAKLVALRKQHSTHIAPSSASPSTTPAAANLTPEEWQELRAARSEAIQSDTDLTTESKKLAERMAAFENQLDAIMIKANPDIAPIIAKFEAGRRPQKSLANAAPSKP